VQAQELGNELRQARERKGLTLDQVQNDTKIRNRYLEAIEAGDLDVLPGMVYARGFIKSYAEYLTLDGQELLERHGLAAERPAEGADESLRRTKSNKQVTASGNANGGSRMFPQVVAVAVVLGLLGGVLFYVNRSGDDQETTNKKEPVAQTQEANKAQVAQPTPQPVQIEPTPAPVVEPPKPKAVVAEAAKAGDKTSYSVTGADALAMEVSVISDCWVQVTADGQTVEMGVVKAGETRTWKADKNISILTGKSKDMKIKLNEQPVALEPLLRGYTYAFERKI